MITISTNILNILRKLAAICYDLLIITALLLVTTMVAIAINHFQTIPPGNHWLQASLLLVVVSYLIISWRMGGQTIGMRAWGLTKRINPSKMSP